MKRNSELRDEWAAPAIEASRPPGVVARAASLPHLILPLVCLVYGISNLVGILHWVDARNVTDQQTTFICGATFASLGLIELRYWWRRLRGE
jgi:hypothetical protein